MKPCTVCNGTTLVAPGTTYERPCRCVKYGAVDGMYPDVNYDEIIDALFIKKRFRSSKPKVIESSISGSRIYYVWRLARFHGGKDVTMPVMANMYTYRDPYVKQLDSFAQMIARRAFGTDMAAAYRWGSVLGYVDTVPDGLPASAYSNGPVIDDNKPGDELVELF